MKSNSTSENRDQFIVAKWEKEVKRLVQLLQFREQINKIILEQSKLVDRLGKKANKRPRSLAAGLFIGVLAMNFSLVYSSTGSCLI